MTTISSTHNQYPLYVDANPQLPAVTKLGQEAINKRIVELQAQIQTANLQPLQYSLASFQTQLISTSPGSAQAISLKNSIARFALEYQKRCAALVPLEVELEKLLPLGKFPPPPGPFVFKIPNPRAKKPK